MLETIGIILRTFLATVLILVLTYWFVKKMGKGFFMPNKMTKHIRMIEYLPMGQDKGVALIQVMDQYCLIGISSGSITLLKELSKDDFLENEEKMEEDNHSTNFSELLEKMKIQDLLKKGKNHE